MGIPSAVTKQLMFGIPHIRVDLTISEKPARIESVRIRVHRFVMKHRPFWRSTIFRAKPAEWLRTTCCQWSVCQLGGSSPDIHHPPLACVRPLEPSQRNSHRGTATKRPYQEGPEFPSARPPLQWQRCREVAACRRILANGPRRSLGPTLLGPTAPLQDAGSPPGRMT